MLFIKTIDHFGSGVTKFFKKNFTFNNKNLEFNLCSMARYSKFFDFLHEAGLDLHFQFSTFFIKAKNTGNRCRKKNVFSPQ